MQIGAGSVQAAPTALETQGIFKQKKQRVAHEW